MSARWPAKSYVLTTGLHSKQTETAPGVRVGRRSIPVCYTRAVAQGQLRLGFGSEEDCNCLLVKPATPVAAPLARNRHHR